jgi:hypothetical protein
MGYSQTYDLSAAFYLKFVGSNSPLVEHELQIGGTREKYRRRKRAFQGQKCASDRRGNNGSGG